MNENRKDFPGQKGIRPVWRPASPKATRVRPPMAFAISPPPFLIRYHTPRTSCDFERGHAQTLTALIICIVWSKFECDPGVFPRRPCFVRVRSKRNVKNRLMKTVKTTDRLIIFTICVFRVYRVYHGDLAHGRNSCSIRYLINHTITLFCDKTYFKIFFYFPTSRFNRLL